MAPIDIDWLLDFLTGEWENIPHVLARWDTLEEEERREYLLDWPMKEEYEALLYDVVATTQLTEGQHYRYQRLLRVMESSRPAIVEILMRGPSH